MNVRGSVIIFILSVSAVAHGAIGDNLLTNPGFETGDFTGWAVGGVLDSGVALDGTTFSVCQYYCNEVNVRSGDYAAYVIVVAEEGTPTFHATFSQTIFVLPGVTYDVGFYTCGGTSHKDFQGGSAFSDVTVIIDGFEQDLSSSCPMGSLPEHCGHKHFVYTVGPGVTELTVTFKDNGLGTTSPYVVGHQYAKSYDDFHFTQIPEPTTVGLMVVGLAGIFAAKQRQKSGEGTK